MSGNPPLWDVTADCFLLPKPMKRWRPVLDLSITCSNFHNGNSRIYQEVDSKRGVGHLDRHNRRLFPCPNSSTISKISEISNKKKGVFQFRALLFGVAAAPLEFTRIVKEVKLIAQARNLRIHQYLDDWLLRSPTQE